MSFYSFLKMHKQYVINNKVPHHWCLGEICEIPSWSVKRTRKQKQKRTDTY